MAEFFVNLIVFILSFAVLIIIHEFGHFITAKAFNVYVNEFAIGFGPVLFKKKKEGAETTFSIRAVPLGGFCSMIGESLPEFSEEEYAQLSESDKEIVELYKSVPENRRLDGIARWKRAIIMVAGVTLNFILAFVLFICSNATMKIPDTWSNQVTIAQSTTEEKYLAESAGWVSSDIIETASYTIYLYNEDGSLINNDSNTTECVEKTSNLKYFFDNLAKEDYQPKTALDKIDLVFTTTEDKNINIIVAAQVNENGHYYWPALGITLHAATTKHLSFGKVMQASVYDLGNGAVAIVKGLGEMFTPEGFEQVGGVISMFQMSSEINSLGISYYFFLWGLISINLAVFNLLPFPGLDGWHFLVLIIEGITRKDLPKKFKNTMSNIGMALLFGLMIVITLKDIIGLF